MKKSAIFINASRIPIVYNNALDSILDGGRIKWVGVDVFDMELPIPRD